MSQQHPSFPITAPLPVPVKKVNCVWNTQALTVAFDWMCCHELLILLVSNGFYLHVESSWIQFGPGGRDSYDWVAGTSTPPLTENHLQGYWNELTSNKVKERTEIMVYVVIVAGSLLFLSVMAFLVYKGCSKIKQNTSSVIQLDFQDADSSAEFLSSLEEQEASEEGSDGLLLMVYLPAPYEKTLTRIARAASISSTRNDAEILELGEENSADQE